MKQLFFSICIFISCNALAQSGNVSVVEDTSIRHVLDLYQTFAKAKRQVNGYRIQLSSRSSRESLIAMKANFIQLYPGTGAYLQYTAPQFKLRVGDFRTRDEANAFIVEVRKDFPSAFIVPDKIVVEGVEW